MSWFGLTDGWYWIELGEVDLLRYVAEDGDDHPYVDYYVVRLWEDLLQLFPAVVDDVPDDLVDLLRGDRPGLEELDSEDPAVDALITWRSDHVVDVGYLANAPGIHCWRQGEQVIISWYDADPGLYTSAPAGEIVVSFTEFMSAIEEFHQNLMAAMETRVAEVTASPPPGVEIDLPQLHAEQADRATWLSRALARTPTTNWDLVRAGAQKA